jgi:hypothetical protein
MDAATFWAAVGAVGTCVAAVITVLLYWKPQPHKRTAEDLPPPPPAPVLAFTGRWAGEKGDLWDLQAELEVFGSQVKGRIRWTLVECPPSLPYAKRIGHSGYEFVEGSLEPECLHLHGYQVDDTTLLAPNDYTIVFGPGRQTVEGTSRSKRWGSGRLQGTVVTPAQS